MEWGPSGRESVGGVESDWGRGGESSGGVVKGDWRLGSTGRVEFWWREKGSEKRVHGIGIGLVE